MSRTRGDPILHISIALVVLAKHPTSSIRGGFSGGAPGARAPPFGKTKMNYLLYTITSSALAIRASSCEYSKLALQF